MSSIGKRIHQAANLVRSDKIKDRSQGLDILQELFASKKALEYAAPKYDDRGKLAETPLYEVFQAVFNAVVLERSVAIKAGTGGSAAERRLAQASRTLRFVVERTAPLLDKSTLKTVLVHLQQTLVVRGQLYEPLAVDYIKALKAIFSYRPHREHLQTKYWFQPVSICFAAILGLTVRKTSDWDSEPPFRSEGDEDDEDELDEDDDDRRPRKKARLTRPTQSGFSSSHAPTTPAAGLRRTTVARATMTPALRELATLLELLFKCQDAPILRYPDIILSFFVRFFEAFTNETTAHVDIVRTLHRIVVELELNARASLVKVVPQIWVDLVPLWSSKNEALREEVVVILTYLLPFLHGSGKIRSSQATSGVEDALRALFDSVVAPPRDVDDLLPLSNILLLSLNSAQRTKMAHVFKTTTFRAGPWFNAVNARAWVVYQLGADVFTKLYELSEQDMTRGVSKAKRAKLESPIHILLDNLRPSAGSNATLHSLKLLIFAVDRQWESFEAPFRSEMFASVVKLLSATNLDTTVQNWVWICIGVFAAKSFAPAAAVDCVSSPTKRPKSESASLVASGWGPIWAVALRRISNAFASRASSHAALQMLISGCVDPVQVSGDIEALLRDLAMQSPPSPSEAVCQFLSKTLELARGDIRLSRLGLQDSVLNWLVAAWAEVDRALKHPTGDLRVVGFDSKSVLLLLLLVCGLPSSSSCDTTPPLPDCPISHSLLYRKSTEGLRGYLLFDRLADAPTAKHDPPRRHGSGAASVQAPTPLQRRVSLTLRRSLEGLLADVDDRGGKYSMTPVKSRLVFEVVGLALLLEASLGVTGTRFQQESIRAVSEVVAIVVPTLRSQAWGPDDLACVLSALNPLLISVPEPRPDEATGLVSPGPASGLPKAQQRQTAPDPSDVMSETLRAVWRHPDLSKAFEDVSSLCRSVLISASDAPLPAATQSQPRTQQIAFDDEDDYGDGEDPTLHRGSRAAGGLAYMLAMGGSELSSSTTADICVRALITSAACRQDGLPVELPDVVDLLATDSHATLLLVGAQVIECLQANVLSITPAQADEVLREVSTSFLQQYSFARNPDVQSFMVHFLHSTVGTWTVDGSEVVTRHARQLCAFFTSSLVQNRLTTWSVRRDLSTFMDAYLDADSSEASWANPDDPQCQDSEGRPLRPQQLLVKLLRDSDSRVRFQVTVSMAHILELLHAEGLSAQPCWDDIAAHLPEAFEEGIETEVLMTGTLCHANILVACSDLRPSAYERMISSCMCADLVGNVIVLLEKSAARLGLPSKTAFYELYATHVHHTIISKTPDLVNLPEELVRGQSGVLTARFHLHATVPQYYVQSDLRRRIEPIARRAGLSKEAALRECFADTAALVVAQTFYDDSVTQSDPAAQEPLDPQALGKLRVELRTLSEECRTESQGVIIDMLDVERDRVLTALLMLAFEPLGGNRRSDDITAAQCFPADPAQQRSFQILCQGLFSGRLARPGDPFFPAAVVFKAVAWFGKEYGALSDKAILHSISTAILLTGAQAPFVDARRRALFSLTGLIAVAHQRINRSLTLLTAILQGLQPFLVDAETFSGASSIATFVVKHVLGLLERDQSAQSISPSTASLLVSTLHHAARHDSSSDLHSSSSSHANKTVTWLQNRFARHSAVAPQSSIALMRPLWAEENTAVSAADLALALQAPVPDSVKLGLLGRLATGGLPVDSRAAAQLISELFRCAAHVSDLAEQDARLLTRLLAARQDVWQLVSIPSAPGVRSTLSVTSETEIIQDIVKVVLVQLQDTDPGLQTLGKDFLQRAFIWVPVPAKAHDISSAIDLPLQRAQLLASPSISRPYDLCDPSNEPDFLVRNDAVRIAQDPALWTRLLAIDLASTRASWSPALGQLYDLLESSAEMTAKLLPSLAHACLLADALEPSEPSFRTVLSRYFQAVLRAPGSHDSVRRGIIDIVVHLRHHPRPGAGALGNDTWLDIPWLALVEQAVRLRLASYGFLFVELAREHGELTSVAILDVSDRDMIHQLYASVDEPDAFYSALPQSSSQELLGRYRHEGQWGSVLELHGALAERGSDKLSIAGVVQSLASSGFNQLAAVLLRDGDIAPAAAETLGTEFAYELAWRTSKWDLPVLATFKPSSSTRMYRALRAAHNEPDSVQAMKEIDACLLSELVELLQSAAQPEQAKRTVFGALLALDDVRRWVEEDAAKEDMVGRRGERLVTLSQSFESGLINEIATIRLGLLEHVLHHEAASSIADEDSELSVAALEVEQRLRISMSEQNRSRGLLQPALNAIMPVVSASKGQARSILKAEEELAEVLWARGEQNIAIRTLQKVYTKACGLVQTAEDKPWKARQLWRLGVWLGEAKLQAPAELLDQYFAPALDLLDPASTPDAYGKVALAYATFVDDEHRRVAASGRIEQLEQARLRASQGLTDLRRQKQSLNKHTQSQLLSQIDHAIRVEEHSAADEEEKLQTLQASQSRYLNTALVQYAAALTYCEGHEDLIYRFVSLWFTQHHNDELNKSLQSHISRIPSWKLLGAVHQLCARLNKGSTSAAFQATLGHTVLRICRDHPFHILFKMISLKSGLPLSAGLHRSRRALSVQSSQMSGSQASRAQAADEILQEARKRGNVDKTMGHVVSAFSAYDEWAALEVKKDSRTSKTYRSDNAAIPGGLEILKLKDLPLPITTEDMPIDKSMRYAPGSFVQIAQYGSKYKVAGGVNAPKITTCMGSDGKPYKQLFKGGDDVRQDAVMAQVFDLANELLRSDSETRRRNLRFRTYKIIPLSPLAGLLQFVNNAQTILDILGPLHQHYNTPPDIRIGQARDIIHRAQDRSTTERINTYKDVCTKVRPVMRHHFLDRHKDPRDWYKMRLNYTRSVATTSIVGHILGLGDRHGSNIMLDNSTGEHVHVDFGIAFDAGRRLPVPERTPFRLTRDVVDAFGFAGTEGVFRRCCEQTLRVLREKKRVLLTIVDVLKHDPLQKWSPSIKVLQAQGTPDVTAALGSEENDPEAHVPEDAQRAVAGVASKLASDLSVETTVNSLIADATSVDNLALHYCGELELPSDPFFRR